LQQRAAGVRQLMVDMRMHARDYTRQYGEDLPEIRDWSWPY
jgi:xylulose-5-phosphate/fructose-6-phosphate phosphoketolase